MWPDGVGRQIAVGNFGTNDNSPLARPEHGPPSSDSVLVSLVAFNIRGEPFETTDPAATVTRQAWDDAARRTALIENYVVDGTDPDQNRTTNWSYDADDHATAVTAGNATTGNQTTASEFGVAPPPSSPSPSTGEGRGEGVIGDSAIASNDLLHVATYPDGGAVTVDYNRQSEPIQTTDQNGTVHQLVRDRLGRQTNDRAATLGAGIDDAVVEIATAFDVRNLLDTVTSLDADGGVVNRSSGFIMGSDSLRAKSKSMVAP